MQSEYNFVDIPCIELRRRFSLYLKFINRTYSFQVEAYPPPAIVWTKDGMQIANNQHYEVSHSTTSDQVTSTVVRIITIEKRQYGTYVCKATNIFGESEAKIELFETIIPMCPPACGGQNN